MGSSLICFLSRTVCAKAHPPIGCSSADFSTEARSGSLSAEAFTALVDQGLYWLPGCAIARSGDVFLSRSKTLASTLFEEWSANGRRMVGLARMVCGSALAGSVGAVFVVASGKSGSTRKQARFGSNKPEFRRDWVLRLLPEPVTFSPPLSRRHDPNTPSSGCERLILVSLKDLPALDPACEFNQRVIRSSDDRPCRVVDWPARLAMTRQALDACTSTSAAIKPGLRASACRSFPAIRKDQSRLLKNDSPMHC